MPEDPLLMGWTVKTRDRDDVHESLVEAIENLRERDPSAKLDHRVVWESTGHSHDSTTYTVQEFGTELGDPTIRIEGGGGGEYRIVAKSRDYPWIQYLPPNQPDDYGWQEELVRLVILSEEFEYVQQNGWEAFISKPFEIVDDLY
jgi:hypothetical protein